MLQPIDCAVFEENYKLLSLHWCHCSVLSCIPMTFYIVSLITKDIYLKLGHLVNSDKGNQYNKGKLLSKYLYVVRLLFDSVFSMKIKGLLHRVDTHMQLSFYAPALKDSGHIVLPVSV